MGWLSHILLAICFLAGSASADRYQKKNPFLFDQTTQPFGVLFMQYLSESDEFSRGGLNDFQTVVDYAIQTANSLRANPKTTIEQKDALMVSFSSALAEMILKVCAADDHLAIQQKTSVVNQALRQAYLKVSGIENQPFINEVKLMVHVLLERLRANNDDEVPSVFDGSSAAGDVNPFARRPVPFNPYQGKYPFGSGRPPLTPQVYPLPNFAQGGLRPPNWVNPPVLGPPLVTPAPETRVVRLDENNEHSDEDAITVSIVNGPRGQPIEVDIAHRSTRPHCIYSRDGSIDKVVLNRYPEQDSPVYVTGPDDQQIEVVAGPHNTQPRVVTGPNHTILRIIIPGLPRDEEKIIQPVPLPPTLPPTPPPTLRPTPPPLPPRPPTQPPTEAAPVNPVTTRPTVLIEVVKGPQKQNIEVHVSAPDTHPHILTNDDGHITRVVLNRYPNEHPIYVNGPHGYPIQVITGDTEKAIAETDDSNTLVRILIPGGGTRPAPTTAKPTKAPKTRHPPPPPTEAPTLPPPPPTTTRAPLPPVTEAAPTLPPVDNGPSVTVHVVKGPDGEDIEIDIGLPDSHPRCVLGNNGQVIKIILNRYPDDKPVHVLGPQGQKIEVILGEYGTLPRVITGPNNEIITVIIPSLRKPPTTTTTPAPTTTLAPTTQAEKTLKIGKVVGPEGQIIEIHVGGNSRTLVNNKGQIFRIIINGYPGRNPLFVPGPRGPIEVISGDPHENPRIVTGPNNQIIRLILPGYPERIPTPVPIPIEEAAPEPVDDLSLSLDNYLESGSTGFFSVSDSRQKPLTYTLRRPGGRHIKIHIGLDVDKPKTVTGRKGELSRIILPDFPRDKPYKVRGPGGNKIHIVAGDSIDEPQAITNDVDEIIRIVLPTLSSESIEPLPEPEPYPEPEVFTEPPPPPPPPTEEAPPPLVFIPPPIAPRPPPPPPPPTEAAPPPLIFLPPPTEAPLPPPPPPIPTAVPTIRPPLIIPTLPPFTEPPFAPDYSFDVSSSSEEDLVGAAILKFIKPHHHARAKEYFKTLTEDDTLKLYRRGDRMINSLKYFVDHYHPREKTTTPAPVVLVTPQPDSKSQVLYLPDINIFLPKSVIEPRKHHHHRHRRDENSDFSLSDDVSFDQPEEPQPIDRSFEEPNLDDIVFDSPHLDNVIFDAPPQPRRESLVGHIPDYTQYLRKKAQKQNRKVQKILQPSERLEDVVRLIRERGLPHDVPDAPEATPGSQVIYIPHLDIFLPKNVIGLDGDDTPQPAFESQVAFQPDTKSLEEIILDDDVPQNAPNQFPVGTSPDNQYLRNRLLKQIRKLDNVLVPGTRLDDAVRHFRERGLPQPGVEPQNTPDANPGSQVVYLPHLDVYLPKNVIGLDGADAPQPEFDSQVFLQPDLGFPEIVPDIQVDDAVPQQAPQDARTLRFQVGNVPDYNLRNRVVKQNRKLNHVLAPSTRLEDAVRRIRERGLPKPGVEPQYSDDTPQPEFDSPVFLQPDTGFSEVIPDIQVDDAVPQQAPQDARTLRLQVGNIPDYNLRNRVVKQNLKLNHVLAPSTRLEDAVRRIRERGLPKTGVEPQYNDDTPQPEFDSPVFLQPDTGFQEVIPDIQIDDAVPQQAPQDARPLRFQVGNIPDYNLRNRVVKQNLKLNHVLAPSTRLEDAVRRIRERGLPRPDVAPQDAPDAPQPAFESPVDLQPQVAPQDGPEARLGSDLVYVPQLNMHLPKRVVDIDAQDVPLVGGSYRVAGRPEGPSAVPQRPSPLLPQPESADPHPGHQVVYLKDLGLYLPKKTVHRGLFDDIKRKSKPKNAIHIEGGAAVTPDPSHQVVYLPDLNIYLPKAVTKSRKHRHQGKHHDREPQVRPRPLPSVDIESLRRFNYFDNSMQSIINLFTSVLNNGPRHVPFFVQSILNAKKQDSFDVKSVFNQMSTMLQSIQEEQEEGRRELQASEKYVELLMEMTIAALEIIRNTGGECLAQPSHYHYVPDYVHAFYNVL